MEVGRRKKEEAVIAMVLAVKNVLTVLAVAIDASLIVSAIVINLLMEEDLDINGEPEIILLENLNLSQWSDILPQIQYRIKLNAENHPAIAESGTAQIPVVEQNLAISPLTPKH
jgi:hypothetical protein